MATLVGAILGAAITAAGTAGTAAAAAGGAGAAASGVGASLSFLGMTGAQIGALAGSYFDTFVLFPALFPPPDIEGARVGDFKLTTHTEGTGYTRAFGRNIRVPGHVIWAGELNETKNTENAGGKSGGGGDYITYTYSRSLAIEVCKCYGYEISRVKKIYANGEEMFEETSNFDETSTLISATWSYSWYYAGPGPTNETYKHIITFASTAAGPDLSRLKPGREVVVSGFSPTLFNGTYTVAARKLQKDGVSWFQVVHSETTSSTAPGSDDLAGDTVTIFQSFPGYSLKLAASIDTTSHLGSLTQDVDPIVLAAEGADYTPAYRDRAYVTFEELELVDFGNILPNFEFLIEVNPLETLETALQRMVQTSGISLDLFDASTLTDPLEGFTITGQHSMATALQPLILAYNLAVRDVGGVLTIEKRTALPTLAVPTTDLVAHEMGSTSPARDVAHFMKPRVGIPREVIVEYIDPAREYQKGATQYRLTNPIGKGHRTVNLSVVLTSAQAQVIARTLAFVGVVTAHKMEVQLPPTYEDQITEGTVISFTSEGNDWEMLIASLERGENGLLIAEGPEEQSQVFTHTASEDDPLT